MAPLTESERHALQALHDRVASPSEAEHARALLATRAEACVYFEQIADLDDLVAESTEARFAAPAAEPRRHRRSRWWPAAAAALLVAGAAGAWLLHHSANPRGSPRDARFAKGSTITWIDENGPVPVRPGQALVAARGPATAVLPDGSTLRAAAGTRMVFHRPGSFTLEQGEVLAVAATATSALRLNAGASSVSARRARMHIWTNGDKAAVALLDGEASVSHRSIRSSRDLGPGSVAWVESGRLLASASLPTALSQRLESGAGTLGAVLPGVRQLALGDEPAADEEASPVAAVRAPRPSVTLNIDASKSAGTYEAIFSRILGGTVRRVGTQNLEPGAPATLDVPDTAGAGTLMVELTGTGGYAVSVRPPGERGLLLVPTPAREATVTVRSSAGRPLPNAQLWLREPHAPHARARLVTTDKEGRADFPLTRDTAVLDVAATGYLPVRNVALLPGADPVSLTVPLEPAPFVLQGTVTDVSAEDLDAGVELLADDGERLMLDPDGDFALTQRADGRPVALRIRRPGRPDLLTTLDPLRPEPHRIALATATEVPPAPTTRTETVQISARLMVRRGSPHSGAIVGVVDRHGVRLRSMRTNADGRFWGEVPADSSLVIEAPGYHIANMGLRWRPNPYLGTLTIDAPSAALVAEIVLDEAPQHSIAVLQHDGAPVADAPLRLDYRASEEDPPVTAVLMTDALGQVRTPTLPRDGILRLTVLRADLGYPTHTLDVDSYPASPPRLSMWYLGRPSDVRATLAEPLRRQPCFAEVRRVAEVGAPRAALVEAPELPWRLPAADGRLVVPALAPGEYQLRAVTAGGPGPWCLVRISPGLAPPMLTLDPP